MTETSPAGGDLPYRNNFQLSLEPVMSLPFDYVCRHFKLEKLMSVFGLLAKLLWALLWPKFGILTRHHRSYRF